MKDGSKFKRNVFMLKVLSEDLTVKKTRPRIDSEKQRPQKYRKMNLQSY